MSKANEALDKKAENARELGLDYEPVPDNFMDALKFDVAMREAVKAEREACAKVCEELLERPSGYQGTWEGYGKFKTQMTGQECAAAIRARSNT